MPGQEAMWIRGVRARAEYATGARYAPGSSQPGVNTLTEAQDSGATNSSGTNRTQDLVTEALRELGQVRLGALRDGSDTSPEDDTAIAELNALYEQSDGDWSVCAQAIDGADADWIYPVMLTRALRLLNQEAKADE
jgi:hypothetical protein